MKAVAKVLGVELLHETNVEALLGTCNEIGMTELFFVPLHFFEETSRVERADAIHHDDYDKFLKLMDESGTSSWELLQNCYTMKDFHEQKITRTLALTQLFLKKIGAGVCRVHGGGFAGVIAAIVPEKEQDNYVEYISRFVGKKMYIRWTSVQSEQHISDKQPVSVKNKYYIKINLWIIPGVYFFEHVMKDVLGICTEMFPDLLSGKIFDINRFSILQNDMS